MDLKQFVPSSVCLACEGCCRFYDERSPWRPKAGPGENFGAGLRSLDGPPDGVLDAGSYVMAVPEGERWRCRFLDGPSNTCGIYPGRPFECRLYPFLLVRHEGRFLVALHLSCPFAQKYYGTPVLDGYAAYLKDFLSSPSSSGFLRGNRALFSDYREARDEWAALFDVEIPGGPDGP